MNNTTKESLRYIANGFSTFFANLNKSIASLIRILVSSSIRTAIKSKKYNKYKISPDCCVLGNGPSLQDDLENRRVKFEGNDVFCVNLFCSSEYFRIIKPRFYFLIDGALFFPKNERHKNHIKVLVESLMEVDWDMCLVLSTLSVTGGFLLDNLKNDHIKIIRFNSTEVDGFKSFRLFCYKHRIGMPRCQSVINFALCVAVNMGYDNIYLYGADHTWTRDLFVDKENIVCYGDRHVYNKNLTIVKKKYNFAHLLGQFSKMFQSHYLLEDYSKSQGVKIWNCSSDSFLDAYDRVK